MHRSIRTALLSLVLLSVAMSGLSASDLTTAQYQQLVSASQRATLERPAQVTLTIGTSQVVFNVTRDAVGNVTARPVPGLGTGELTIAQISISVTINDNGSLVPSAVTVVTTGQVIQSYNVQINADGTLASVTPVGIYARSTGSDGAAQSSGDSGTGGGSTQGGGGFVTANQFNDGGVTTPPPGAGTTNVSPAR